MGRKTCGLNDTFVETDAAAINHALQQIGANFYQVCGRPKIVGKRKIYNISWRREGNSCLPGYANASYIQEKEVARRLQKNYGITLSLLNKDPKAAVKKAKEFLAKEEEKKINKLTKKQAEVEKKLTRKQEAESKRIARKTDRMSRLEAKKAKIAAEAEARKLKVQEIKSKADATRKVEKAEKVVAAAEKELKEIKTAAKPADKPKVEKAIVAVKEAKAEIRENKTDVKQAETKTEMKTEVKEAVSTAKEAVKEAAETVKNVEVATETKSSGGSSALEMLLEEMQ